MPILGQVSVETIAELKRRGCQPDEARRLLLDEAKRRFPGRVIAYWGNPDDASAIIYTP